jgi:hypothetical protein
MDHHVSREHSRFIATEFSLRKSSRSVLRNAAVDEAAEADVEAMTWPQRIGQIFSRSVEILQLKKTQPLKERKPVFHCALENYDQIWFVV